MGGITSFATTAIQALGAANTVLGAFNNYQDKSGRQDYQKTKALQDLEIRNAQERAAYEKSQLKLSAEQTESERRAALRRAVAKQRANFGASGTGSSDGSSRAVLLGLFDESDEERARRESLDTLKSRAIDMGVAQQQRINTLQLAQLKEKNKINRYISAFDSVSSIFND